LYIVWYVHLCVPVVVTYVECVVGVPMGVLGGGMCVWVYVCEVWGCMCVGVC
jgi:hypothetical protein